MPKLPMETQDYTISPKPYVARCRYCRWHSGEPTGIRTRAVAFAANHIRKQHPNKLQ
jgi:hypothetical protein